MDILCNINAIVIFWNAAEKTNIRCHNNAPAAFANQLPWNTRKFTPVESVRPHTVGEGGTRDGNRNHHRRVVCKRSTWL